MIIHSKLTLFQKYKGNEDLWERFSSVDENNEMTDNEWHLIWDFIQGIRMVEKGGVSDSYKRKIEEKIRINCDNQITIKKLYEIANDPTIT